MKRTLVASAVGIALGSSINVEAGTAGLTGVWTGTYVLSMFSPGGAPEGTPTTPQSWTFDFDAGTVDIANTTSDFFGSILEFHDASFIDNGDGTYSGTLLWNWDVYTNITALIDWDITDSGEVTTLYGQFPPESTLLPGENFTFDGVINQVPLPASAWLLGSGLLGLIGVARRKSNA